MDLIPDPALLQELINFNLTGNFDRVLSCVGLVLGLEEIHNISKRRAEHLEGFSEIEKEFDRLFVNNTRIFNARLTQATAFL